MCVSVGVRPLRPYGPAPLSGGAVTSHWFCYTLFCLFVRLSVPARENRGFAGKGRDGAEYRILTRRGPGILIPMRGFCFTGVCGGRETCGKESVGRQALAGFPDLLASGKGFPEGCNQNKRRGKSRCPPRFAGSFLTECGQKRGVVRRTFFRNAEKKSVFPAMAEISCRKEIRLLAGKWPKSANKREVLFRKIFWLMPTERIGCQRSLPNSCFLSVNMRVFFLFAFRDYW